MVFDRFSFDSERRELRAGAEPVHIGPKAFDLLSILIAGWPRAMRKQDLCERIWQDSFVDESNLAGLINELRGALNDRARNPRFIRTVHGFGYAFCCEPRREDAPPPAGMIVFRGREFPLREGINILGRDPTADVQIDDVTVSRKHATIEIRPDGVTIADLDSKNGTFVDGVQLTGSAPLLEGHPIVLGDAALTFRRSPTGSSTVSISRLRRKRT